ncbi:hypothetical protein EW146_g5899 [Bondarzewia mesenterica]|uniref:SPIN90/Ldb17 leucine-rich domain-containing protein n=1 Tax=Bondarzewia mesenterica TaxID=1095465 RepID=A0A4S4LVV1_9AGAM|nr:hypothetical protein EW146_g5899 [Bondarzewia mesenterica]
MDDAFGIVYLIENAQQFWSELDDIVRITSNATLSNLDSTLKRFISFCASYHEQYLQSPLQLEHACGLLLDSELFTFHSERMCEILTDEATANTDPHYQLILYNVLLLHGQRQASFLRSYKRWQPIIPLLMDHVLVEIDLDIEDTYSGSTSGPSTGWKGLAIPIEAMLRSLGVRLLYEVCRASKLSKQELKIFDDEFIDRLFDLVEQTRNMQDESFNYSVIKLIVALNEQFMVASIKGPITDVAHKEVQNPQSPDVRRKYDLHAQPRGRSSEDLVMQLLVLKILYLLFTTNGTSEYFYTNDLCVLVDVFLRELGDLDDDSESLRHTYLRVLHPLLTKTQLRRTPYKRPQIVRTLESLIEHPEIRDVSPTTKRLVERCLSGEWCVQLRKGTAGKLAMSELERTSSPSDDRIAKQEHLAPPSVYKNGSQKKSFSRSVENLRSSAASSSTAAGSAQKGLEALRKQNNDSAVSLLGVAGATSSSSSKKRDRINSVDVQRERSHGHHEERQREKDTHVPPHVPIPLERPSSTTSTSSAAPTAAIHENGTAKKHPHRRTAPAPPKRRKPPAAPIAVGQTNSGATITAIKSSSSTPNVNSYGKLGRV